MKLYVSVTKYVSICGIVCTKAVPFVRLWYGFLACFLQNCRDDNLAELLKWYFHVVFSRKLARTHLCSSGSTMCPFSQGADAGSVVCTCMSLSERVNDGVSCIGVTIIGFLLCCPSKNEYWSAISRRTYFFCNSWSTYEGKYIRKWNNFLVYL